MNASRGLRILHLVLLVLSGMLCEEPHCSRFHYEEQTLSKIIRLESYVEKLEKEFKQRLEASEKAVDGLNSKPSLSASVLERIEGDLLERLKSSTGSSVYVRWGRDDCPGNGTDLLYNGYMAGNRYNFYGGGATSVCLPEAPTWAKYVDGDQSGAKIFGAEIEVDHTASEKMFGTRVYNSDMTCAVCTSVRNTVAMFPGHSRCLAGWTEEYRGYLVASHEDWKASSDFTCLDANMLKGRDVGDDEHVVKIVEAQCGTLKCPPYVQGREIACAVCTK